jgi:NADH-quinone oxidoreductase subunit N
VAAFLATGVKAAGFGVLARLLTEALGFQAAWTGILPFLAVLTMVVGNLGALVQTSVKRMLAYSSVAHAGYVMVGLSAAAAAPADEVERAVAFYLLAYTLMTAGAFGWIAWSGAEGEEKSRLADLQGLGLRRPAMGLALSVFLFSLAGMTPTAGFFGKYYLFKLAVDQGMVWLAVAAVLNSFVSAYYYLRVVAFLYMKPEGPEAPVPAAPSRGLGFVFFLCALGSILAGFLKFSF